MTNYFLKCLTNFINQPVCQSSAAPHFYIHLILSAFKILVIVTDVYWYLIVTIICNFLMTNHVDQLFMCLLATCVSEKCLLKSFARF